MHPTLDSAAFTRCCNATLNKREHRLELTFRPTSECDPTIMAQWGTAIRSGLLDAFNATNAINVVAIDLGTCAGRPPTEFLQALTMTADAATDWRRQTCPEQPPSVLCIDD